MDISKQDIIDAAIELDRMERQAAYLEIQPHWQTWADREEISLTEAVFLAMSIDPALYNSSTGRIKLGHKFSFRDGDSINHTFDDLYETAYRAANNSPPKIPYVRSRGSDFIVKNYEFAKWWKSIGRELPAEFPVGKVEQSDNDNEPQQTTKERNMMLSVLLAMAIDKYDYDPLSTRNSATGDNAGSIQAALQKIGLSITSDTVRGYMKEAYEIHKDSIVAKKS